MARSNSVTQNDRYREYARQAQEQLERASSDSDKAAWLWIAQSWLNLLPQNESKVEDTSR
jgi:hypothetical protein